MIAQDLGKISAARLERLKKFKEELQRLDDEAYATNKKSMRPRSPAKFLQTSDEKTFENLNYAGE